MKCPRCGGTMEKKKDSFGKFLECIEKGCGFVPKVQDTYVPQDAVEICNSTKITENISGRKRR